MTGKISDAEKISKTGNKINSNMVKISSSKSILSYQNGSALNAKNRECDFLDEGMPAEGYAEESSMSEDPFGEGQNLKSECLDLLRKKLISDWSLSVFSSDLENKLTKMEPIEISKERQSVVQKLVVQISQLSDAEKLLLYLKLPSSTSSPFDPLRQPLNPLGNRQEIQQTIVWIKTHLEEDSEISIPKQDVYDQYLKYCENVSMKPLSTADFGKVMKQVYPGVRPRRLGTRGNSRYCYSGMRNTYKLPTPILPRSSTENFTISNGFSSEGTQFLLGDGNKFKKVEKSKRKWTSSSGCRNDKFAATNRSSNLGSDKASADQLKPVKKSKSQKEEEEEDEEGEEGEEEEEEEVMEDGHSKIKEAFLSDPKCENSSRNNSFSAFDMECGRIRNEFGSYLKKTENELEDLSSKSGTVGDLMSKLESEKRQSGFHEIPFQAGQPETNALTVKEEGNRAEGEFGTVSKEESNSSKKGDQTAKANKVSINRHIVGATNGFNKDLGPMSEKQKTAKAKAKRPAKNFKKSYVPIQPKPAESSKMTVLFEKSQISSLEKKKESEGFGMCEESDSQEPEEEIVRYFKHLDENELKRNGLIDGKAVKNPDGSSSVQISSISQMVASNSRRNPVAINYPGGKEILAEAHQQIVRSQSCFEEEHGEVFNPAETREQIYMPPRSQSSVELPTSNGHRMFQEMSGPNSKSDGRKKKISHLRILLEKSILSDQSGGQNPYPNLKTSPVISPCSNPNVTIPNSRNSVSASIYPGSEPDFLVSNVGQSVEGDFLKLNGLKVLTKGNSFMAQSPSTRTKHFSFTPISPGPRSPLKPPSAALQSTPTNSRDNSQNDHFLSPSERKSGHPPSRSDETVFQNLSSGSSAGHPNGSRPRSYSSTNFYRSRGKRNSSKPTGFDRTLNPPSKNQVPPVPEMGFPLNSPFPGPDFGSGGESLSNEVQKFLENNSELEEDGAAGTIRSRSVPLNRMISGSAWIPSQNPIVYSGYFNLGNSSEPGKLSGIVGSSPKCAGDANMSNFASNREMANLPSNSLAGELFSGDPAIPQLNQDHYFSEDFQRASGTNFPEGQSFAEESAFPSKLDLHSGGSFGGAFASDSDPGGIADNIKSYLPDFGGLESKGLVEPDTGAGEEAGSTDRKLFENSLYEGGNDNSKDPVITSFKPVLMNEISDCPSSPVLNFFGSKINEDSQQLIEFFDFED